MASLSPSAQNTLTVGASVFVACAVLASIRQMLALYRNAAIIPPCENKPQYITQEVEDSLKPSTLEKLLDSPSWVIRDTTSIIIYERALHDKATFSTILHFISRPDYETREKGIRALNLMMNTVTIRFLHSTMGYIALVKCLEHCVTDYEHNTFDPEWDNWPFRDVIEQFTLSLLIQLVRKFGPGRLLRFHFTDLWLAKEPWGATAHERETNFTKALQANNQKLNDILSPIYEDPVGRIQLETTKLISKKSVDLGNSFKISEESVASNDFSFIYEDVVQRRNNNSSAEYLRRRHREAMVLNDGSRPLGRADIIQRE